MFLCQVKKFIDNMKKLIKVKGKKVLITGGTGSLGEVLVKKILKEGASSVIVYSRDEYKQSEMLRKDGNRRVQYWLGDVRDLDRLNDACEGVDYIFHLAAFKRMDQSSINTFDVAEVNIKGTRNVMLAGKRAKKIIVVSTDKAYSPSCIYGASKLIAERIALAYQNSVVWRFGNFKNSRGSVWQIFADCVEKGIPLPITNPDATRYVVEIEDVCRLLLSESDNKLFYPRNLASLTVSEIADEVAPGHPRKIVGLREGEKVDESFDEHRTSRDSKLTLNQ